MWHVGSLNQGHVGLHLLLPSLVRDLPISASGNAKKTSDQTETPAISTTQIF